MLQANMEHNNRYIKSFIRGRGSNFAPKLGAHFTSPCVTWKFGFKGIRHLVTQVARLITSFAPYRNRMRDQITE